MCGLVALAVRLVSWFVVLSSVLAKQDIRAHKNAYLNTQSHVYVDWMRRIICILFLLLLFFCSSS